MAAKYTPLPSLPEDMESPMLAGAEEYQWEAVPNLDLFFARLYRYWAGKGLTTIVLSGALNLAALGFTVAFSGFLLLGVNWHALLTAPCIAQDTCDIISVALITNPLKSRGLAMDVLLLAYLAIFGAYWAWTALHYMSDIRDMMEVRHWVCNKLGVSDRGVALMTWAEVLHKVVRLQATTRLCMTRDLNEHDIVGRIMRKDNYMIAFVNKGVLRLTPPPLRLVVGRATAALARGAALLTASLMHHASEACAGSAHTQMLVLSSRLAAGSAWLYGWVEGNRARQQGRSWSLGVNGQQQRRRSVVLAGRTALMTKTLEWNIRWCILDYMFDDKFCVRREFLEQPQQLKKRLRTAAVVNAVLSPFLLLFLLLYFFLRNAERFYHHPGSAGSRRWTALARWHLREFNELPHYIAHRLDAAHAPACHYLAQFPSQTIASIARFVAFVAGSFTALFLLLTMLDERLLERPLMGRHLVWWLASLGVVLTASRSFINEAPVAYDPEAAMQQMVVHTHYLPRHWRGQAHTAEVQAQFNQLFQLKVLLFLEELASVVLTPFMLYFTLPQSADHLVRFVSDFTVHVEGVGDVCSLACFDLQAHGNPKYGAPSQLGGRVRKDVRSKQGKLEKSLLTFMATYPTWEPGPAGKAMLMSLYQQQQQAAGMVMMGYYPPPSPHMQHMPMAPGLQHPGLHAPLSPWAAASSTLPASPHTQHHSVVGPFTQAAVRAGATMARSHLQGARPDRAYREIHLIDMPGEHVQGRAGLAEAQQQQGGHLYEEHHAAGVHSTGEQAEWHHQQQQGEQPAVSSSHANGGAGSHQHPPLSAHPLSTSSVLNEHAPAGVQAGNGASHLYDLGDLQELHADSASFADRQHDPGAPNAAADIPGIQSSNSQASQQQAPEQHAGSHTHSNGHSHLGSATGFNTTAVLGGGGTSTQAWGPMATSLQCSIFGISTLPAVVQAPEVVSIPSLCLPPNETDELTRRLCVGHAVLQGLYEQSDATVQHRRLSRFGSAMGGSMSGMSGSLMWGGAGAWGYHHALAGTASQQLGRSGLGTTGGAASLHDGQVRTYDPATYSTGVGTYQQQQQQQYGTGTGQHQALPQQQQGMVLQGSRVWQGGPAGWQAPRANTGTVAGRGAAAPREHIHAGFLHHQQHGAGAQQPPASYSMYGGGHADPWDF